MNFFKVVCGWWLLGLLLTGGAPARADAVLLVGGPINLLGQITASGHVALLLDRLCSDDHVHMRLCRAGEPGSVVSRYPNLKGKLDWLAIAPGAYLFAADEATEIPTTMSKAEFVRVQARYEAEHASSFLVDPGAKGWVQLTGEAYRRRLVLLRVHTTSEQDERLMNWLNERPNVSHFNVFYANCADLIAEMLDVLFPGAVHRSYLLDAGMMTPKQVAAGLHGYAKRHPELGWETAELPQVPGDLRRSGHLYGVTEAYLKRYWFLLPLDYLLPVELGAVTTLGLCDHRYAPRPEVQADDAEFFGSSLGQDAGQEGAPW